ncbi:MAG: hypothetical protein HYV14_15835 [Elusimicrobia bacterium]|nr:hypothetical protein [Elusimicrobiota bacterium]
MTFVCLVLSAVMPASAGELEYASASASAIVEKARGAWFRKVVSPEGAAFEGLEAWGVLPKPVFDPAREHRAAPGEESYKSGPLDRPDVYLGLHAEGAEVDAGLIWDHVYGADGRDTGEFAYRVYWRTSKGGWQNPAVGAPDDLYLRPGDRFALTLRALPDGSARLSVRRAGRNGAAAGYQFPVPGLLAADGSLKPLSFKRVHSIDQFRLEGGLRHGNEGRPALATRTTLNGGRWEGAHLLRSDGARAAMSGSLATVARGVDASGRYGAVFPGAGVGKSGAEEMRILPPRS